VKAAFRSAPAKVGETYASTRIGWYLPTHGDTTAYGLAQAQAAGSTELCGRVVAVAEQAGFEYLLIRVGSTCWEAWISGAFVPAQSKSHQAADRGVAGPHQSRPDGQDDATLD